jgi:transketolase
MNIDELKSHALAARRDIVTMIYESGIGHPGGALSIIDILTWIYYQEVDLAASPRARVVMSKGHAVAAQYAMLYQKGKSIAASSIPSARSIRACRDTPA